MLCWSKKLKKLKPDKDMFWKEMLSINYELYLEIHIKYQIAKSYNSWLNKV